MQPTLATSRGVLLKRRGLVFADSLQNDALPARLVNALEVELANLGYVLSTRLRARLLHTSIGELTETRRWVWSTLAAELGANHRHVPLFRSFPEGIPDDTDELWIRRVLIHFLQGTEQPCLFCQKLGTTHVLSGCLHVVCDSCFDASNYSGCPVCVTS